MIRHGGWGGHMLSPRARRRSATGGRIRGYERESQPPATDDSNEPKPTSVCPIQQRQRHQRRRLHIFTFTVPSSLMHCCRSGGRARRFWPWWVVLWCCCFATRQTRITIITSPLATPGLTPTRCDVDALTAPFDQLGLIIRSGALWIKNWVASGRASSINRNVNFGKIRKSSR